MTGRWNILVLMLCIGASSMGFVGGAAPKYRLRGRREFAQTIRTSWLYGTASPWHVLGEAGRHRQTHPNPNRR